MRAGDGRCVDEGHYPTTRIGAPPGAGRSDPGGNLEVFDHFVGQTSVVVVGQHDLDLDSRVRQRSRETGSGFGETPDPRDRRQFGSREEDARLVNGSG